MSMKETSTHTTVINKKQKTPYSPPSAPLMNFLKHLPAKSKFLSTLLLGLLSGTACYSDEWVDQVNSSIKTINFNNEILSYQGASGRENQDEIGSVTVEDNGATLRIAGNRWKAMRISGRVKTNTYLEFDFASSSRGEVHAVGFEKNQIPNNVQFFSVYGTQNWGIKRYKNYSGVEKKHYSIPVGKHFNGPFELLCFVADDDVAKNAESVFSNVRVYSKRYAGLPPASRVGFYDYNNNGQALFSDIDGDGDADMHIYSTGQVSEEVIEHAIAQIEKGTAYRLDIEFTDRHSTWSIAQHDPNAVYVSSYRLQSGVSGMATIGAYGMEHGIPGYVAIAPHRLDNNELNRSIFTHELMHSAGLWEHSDNREDLFYATAGATDTLSLWDKVQLLDLYKRYLPDFEHSTSPEFFGASALSGASLLQVE